MLGWLEKVCPRCNSYWPQLTSRLDTTRQYLDTAVNPPLESLLPTLDAMRTCGFGAIIAQCEPSVREYQPVLEKAAQEAQRRGDTAASAALQLLTAACQPFLKASDPYTPFIPLFQLQDRRGVIPSDFSREQGQLLSEFANELQDAELAARLSDLGWVILRDAEAARRAVRRYLDAADNAYSEKHWPEKINRLERALRLALQIRGETELLEAAVGKLKIYLEPSHGQAAPPGAERVCELLLDVKRQDAFAIASTLEQWACLAAQAGDFHRQHALMETAARGFRIANEPARANAATVSAAEALVQVADSAKAAGQAIVATHWLTQAVTALQRCGGQQNRVATLQHELEAMGKATLGEMKRISFEFDATELAAAAVKAMQSKDITEALLRFAFLVQPLQRQKLEAQALDLAGSAPFANLVDRRVYNGDGRLVAIIPPLLSSQGEEKKIALRATCYEHAKLHHLAMVTGVILPARDELWRLHAVSLEALAALLRNSPFFPAGRQSLWIKGLFAGFEGNFDTALSLLIPQFEHALRKQLEARGVLVWRVDAATSIHSERGLGELLDFPEATDVLGEDLKFELQGLLSERIGHNIRNELAHGLLSEAAFQSAPAIYLWWLLYQLAVGTRTPRAS